MNIELCASCKGKGIIEYRDDSGFVMDEKCKNCNSTGRILTRTYSYKVPFDMNKHLIHATDSKIIDLIRDLESKKHDMNNPKNMFDV